MKLSHHPLTYLLCETFERSMACLFQMRSVANVRKTLKLKMYPINKKSQFIISFFAHSDVIHVTGIL